ncbi:MAG: carboxymuconolactone decarboxylase family protein [Rhodospirillales bacterium]|nr:carboxymuconolactone decarboxylase family protein [Rhodospirillales bacterium]
MERLPYPDIAPGAVAAIRGIEAYLRGCGLEHDLLELVKTRASQINGCAFCLDMHFRAAMRAGERPERLLMLDAWEESSLYTPRERAALAWTETVTRIAETHAPDAAYEAVRGQFSDKELVDLTTAIGTINLWNRLAVAFRSRPLGETAR